MNRATRFLPTVRASVAFEAFVGRLARRALQLGAGGLQARQALLRAGVDIALNRTDAGLADVLAGAQAYRRRQDEPLVVVRFNALSGEHAQAALALRQRVAAASGHEASDLHVVAFAALDRLDDAAFHDAVAKATLQPGRPRRGGHELVRYLHPEERELLTELKREQSREAVFEEAFAALTRLGDDDLRLLFEGLPSMPTRGHVRLSAGQPGSARAKQADDLVRRLQQQLLPATESTPWRLAVRLAAQTQGRHA